MRYNIKNILCSTALSLVIGLVTANEAHAQGVVSLAEDAPILVPNLDQNNDIPDEISLFEDHIQENSGLVTPPEKSNPTSEAETFGNEASLGLPEIEIDENAGDNPIIIENDKAQMNLPKPNNNPVGVLGGMEIEDSVFSQMSDIEKQTALLSLELRREKVQNEIEALKNQRKKAVDEERAKEEEKKQKRIEWEKEQEKKILQEQQKLRELDLQFEKLRQEKLLKSYKNKMLEEQQEWIKNNFATYGELNGVKKEKDALVDDFKTKLTEIKNMAGNLNVEATRTKEFYAKEIADLQTQISILKARIEAQARELEKEKQNPFAENAEEAEKEAEVIKIEEIIKLSDLYAVMEIKGKGENLSAKLLNKDGNPFMVKKGTALQTGHVVDEINSTYIRADKGGLKDYLYFAAGGVLDQEPTNVPEFSIKPDSDGANAPVEKKASAPKVMTSVGIPGLGTDMFIR